MANNVTITFRAKRTGYLRADFSAGDGYRIPKLSASHLSFTERDTLSQLLTQGLNNPDVTRARLANLAGITESYVDADSPGDWAVKPLGNGFMAECSITRPLTR